jgi:hypothetical protein
VEKKNLAGPGKPRADFFADFLKKGQKVAILFWGLVFLVVLAENFSIGLATLLTTCRLTTCHHYISKLLHFIIITFCHYCFFFRH